MDSSRSQHSSFLQRLFNRNKPNTKNELAMVIEDASKRHIIDEDTIEMLNGVFDIAKLRIADIMIPRVDMITIDSKCTIAQAIEQIAKYGHSRYPLVSEDKDHIDGIIMAKDLLPYALKQDQDISLKSLARPVTVVPESKRVDSMLKEFQESRFHMALVVDEFGGICGLVTIEDILELIVGDIDDEYDEDDDIKDDKNIVAQANGNYIVKGLTSIEEFNEFFNTVLPPVDVDTIAGMVIHASGHLPQKDEIVKIGKFIFKVTTVTKRQVHLLQVSIDNSVEMEEE